ncbi:MAG: SulP family inorganic anion transporter, partial [Acidimicrobiia bacterium]|nr:SulP family inorganic anion transporter [Acidimicrobiia bacterium]
MISLSLVSLVFSGPLAIAHPRASMVVLAATGVMNLIIALAGTFPGTVIIPQDATSAVLAAALAAVVVGLPSDVAVSTAFAIVAIGSLTTALIMLALGWFRLGSVIRYIPYPVMGGFLAGTGVLLVVGAADLITDGFEWSNARLGSLVLGMVLGATLLVVASRNQHPLAVPGMIIAAVAAFFVSLQLGAVSIDQAREMGLLGASPGRFGVPEVAMGAVDWSSVISAIPALITVPIVAVVSLLLNVGGLELVADQDADFDGELRSAGLANLAGAAGGAAAGYHAISLSSFGYRMGVKSWGVTIVVASVCIAGALVGPFLVAYLPVPIIGSLLAMLGFSFLWDWVVGGYRRMTHVEYLLMLVIARGLVVLGFLIGIAFGLAAAVLLFAATYSRLDPIRHTFTGADRFSSLERSVPERTYLSDRGRSVQIAELEGFLFFGTAHTAARRIMTLIEPEDVTAVVLDFRRVQGMDSTSAMV